MSSFIMPLGIEQPRLDETRRRLPEIGFPSCNRDEGDCNPLRIFVCTVSDRTPKKVEGFSLCWQDERAVELPRNTRMPSSPAPSG